MNRFYQANNIKQEINPPANWPFQNDESSWMVSKPRHPSPVTDPQHEQRLSMDESLPITCHPPGKTTTCSIFFLRKNFKKKHNCFHPILLSPPWLFSVCVFLPYQLRPVHHAWHSGSAQSSPEKTRVSPWFFLHFDLLGIQKNSQKSKPEVAGQIAAPMASGNSNLQPERIWKWIFQPVVMIFTKTVVFFLLCNDLIIFPGRRKNRSGSPFFSRHHFLHQQFIWIRSFYGHFQLKGYLHCQSLVSFSHMFVREMSRVPKSTLHSLKPFTLYRVSMPGITLPETNIFALKMDGWKITFLLGWLIFRCENVSFRECRVSNLLATSGAPIFRMSLEKGSISLPFFRHFWVDDFLKELICRLVRYVVSSLEGILEDQPS